MLPGSGIPLRLFDSAAGEVRPTAPGDTARMYVCGITPYDATHIGHAATYVAFDLINRVWRDGGHRVRYVQNVTDVDDPLLERATSTGADWRRLAREQIQLFRDDMAELRVLPPDEWVGVVESIPMLVSRIGELIRQGAAYRVEDDWYYSIAADRRFGSVSGLDREQQLLRSAACGGDPERPGKRDPLDPLLWRAARAGEPSWESELGPGRPGWHLECAAIAVEFLGTGFDVQGGGSDLLFPHHEMCASEASEFTGEWPFARHYVHTGMVAFGGRKMSKSDGNLVFVNRLLAAGVEPAAVRLSLLNHHYRSDWEWRDADVTAATARLEHWRRAVSFPTGPRAHAVLDEVRRLLADDLRAPEALRVVDDWAEEQRLRGGEDPTGPGLLARTIDSLLGIAL